MMPRNESRADARGGTGTRQPGHCAPDAAAPVHPRPSLTGAWQ